MKNSKPSLKIRAQAEQELRRRKVNYKTPPFRVWLRERFPTWDWDAPHIELICRSLENMITGKIDKRLLIMMPPRHGKSELVTVRWVAWMIEKDPSIRAIIGAYNGTFATTFSKKVKDIAGEMPYVHIRRDQKAKANWETTDDGGIFATGVGSGVTGRGGNIVVIDDPVKNREEANSLAYRNKVWNWYKDDMYTRLEPDAFLVVIMTQWHEDDLAGRLIENLDDEFWTVLRLPAIAESVEERNIYHDKVGLPLAAKDTVGRKEGEALWPWRWPLKVLEQTKKTLGRSFAALFQQRPEPIEGGLFSRDNFHLVGDFPRAGPGRKFVRYWDKAGTADGGKYTAGLLMMRQKKTYYVIDVVRGQWAAPKRERIIKTTAALDKREYGRVTIYSEQEGGSGGKESMQATIANLAGYTVKAHRPTGSKEARAEPFSIQMEAGNVFFMEGDWNKEYIGELESFPGKYDDQVDASSGAFNALSGGVTDLEALLDESLGVVEGTIEW